MSMEELNSAQAAFQAKVAASLYGVPETDLRIPTVAPGYSEIAARLLIRHEEGVSVFNGGALEYRPYGIKKSWLLPVEVEDKQGHTNFHLLYLNCTPQDCHDVPTSLSYARTTGLKVGDLLDIEAQRLHRSILIGDQTPRIVVRPSLTGSLYYPKISTRLTMPSPELLVKRLSHLSKVLELPIDVSTINAASLKNLTQGFELWEEYPQFVLGTPERIHSEAGIVFMYPVISPDDPWQYYQLFTNRPLDKINKQTPTILRTDSGCDIGQLYRDLGCDCREQFITSLKAIHGVGGDDGGIVVHIPTQDGRGYGMSTKMETEGVKRGDSMVFNGADDPLQPLDTIEAAKRVFGNDYDIRTYDGVGRILKQLGFRRITLLTDNKDKIAGLESAGLEVTRVPTGTRGNGSNDHHIRAKHRTARYFCTD